MSQEVQGPHQCGKLGLPLRWACPSESLGWADFWVRQELYQE